MKRRVEHVLDDTRVHHAWDNRIPPLISIGDGDTVSMKLPMSASGMVGRGASYDDVDLDPDTSYRLVGPIAVHGAEPGDTLQIELLELTVGAWGWTVVLPDAGLLPEDFPDPFIRYFDLAGRDTAILAPGIEIPIEPFLGTMGTAPDDPTAVSVFPPHKGGGNIDVKHLTRGSSLFLPIWCAGGLFSCGDPHAAQGDGEVCVSAIECDMQAVLRFHLHKRTISAPRFLTPGSLRPRADPQGSIGTMGISSDLMDGAKRAVRAMIELLCDDYELGREDAYVLCSLAGDLKIFEIVDAGVWNVGMTIPLAVFSRSAT